ncbi:MAG: exodeoxyribonuclease III [Alphaproteobacteria bacterium CG_4_9_14_3_um_filter_47_13]|nr:MAG: exodeoxyribonuclease III [Alphaproteobacteria bacterium CG_4_9_14_3_um_filter_47_13]
MRILTWNINSVRLRLPRLLEVAGQCQPDIICLQETKTPDESFPIKALIKAGYEHTHIHGMKSYNGVAVLSRVPFTTSEIHHRVGKEDCRHISVYVDSRKFGKPVQIHCLYIPAGGDEPDTALNPKFDHKLKFVDEMARWFRDNNTENDPLVALGDFNIAPLEHDVWSHRQLLKVVSHTPVEVEKLKGMQDSLDWQDAIRHFIPEDQKCYTWWSYRNKDWRKSNRGRRLDHIWITKPLVPHLKAHTILTDARDGLKPSDHVPVMIDLDL